MSPDILKDIPPERLPRHIAVIMDGNGRWAREKGRIRLFGHRQGIIAVRETVRECHRLGVSFLTLYAFSVENWKRPIREIAGLWTLLKYFVKTELPELKKKGVRLNIIGQMDRLPKDVMKVMRSSIEELAPGNSMLLTIALSYSGRDDITCAVRQIARKAKEPGFEPESITEDDIAALLNTHDMPDPDLLIRTSGEFRISNFMLWQLAYSEIYVTQTLWPDFSKEDLHDAIRDYARRQRRFGLTGEQLIRGDDDPSR